MTVNDHTALGIAITVVYVPVAAIDGFLAFHRHHHSRMPWYSLFLFSLFRIVSGILLAVYPSNMDNLGVIIAAIITLGVGVIPLMMATVGLLRVVCSLDFPHNDALRQRIIYSRVGFGLGIALIAAGGGLAGQYDVPQDVTIGTALGKAGYLVLAAMLALMLLFAAYFLRRRAELSPASRHILLAIFAAAPFQVVRLAYALLGEFNYGQPQWSPLFGPVGPFVGMVLLMELVAAIIFLTTGYIIPPMELPSKHQQPAPGKV